MVSILVDLQRDSIGNVDELLALGLPDWRGPALTAAIADVVVRHADELAVDERAALDAFVDGLSARFSAVGSCGLPDALVHGDCHPGNARGTAASVTLLDWGDSGVGHPLLDQPGFLDRIEEAGWVAPVAARWLELWREAVPGSDPGRAAELLAPIAAARMAVIYRKFLDDIEPSEQAYHRADVPDWLHRTAALLGPAEQRPAPAEA